MNTLDDNLTLDKLTRMMDQIRPPLFYFRSDEIVRGQPERPWDGMIVIHPDDLANLSEWAPGRRLVPAVELDKTEE